MGYYAYGAKHLDNDMMDVVRSKMDESDNPESLKMFMKGVERIVLTCKSKTDLAEKMEKISKTIEKL